jgi:hypothetical protein
MFLISFFGNALMERATVEKLGATDVILLECCEAKLAERNGMKLYCVCDSPAERRKRVCGDEGEEA